MKRFIVETSDDGTDEKVRGLLYLGNESPRADAVDYMLNIVQVAEVRECKRADGKPRMTPQQRDRLWEMCGNYNVPFREDDYRQCLGDPDGYVSGWVGGPEYAAISVGYEKRKTIYVGVDPEGRSHT